MQDVAAPLARVAVEERRRREKGEMRKKEKTARTEPPGSHSS